MNVHSIGKGPNPKTWCSTFLSDKNHCWLLEPITVNGVLDPHALVKPLSAFPQKTVVVDSQVSVTVYLTSSTALILYI